MYNVFRRFLPHTIYKKGKEPMKKRILKIAAISVTVIFVAWALWLANAIFGNPISYALATHTAEKHLEECYSESDLVIDGVSYSFKHGYYHAYVSSPSSMDTSFTLSIGMGGRLLMDDYEDRVINKWNTAERIGGEYRESVDEVLNSDTFPYNAHIGFGEIIFVQDQSVDDPSMPSYSISTADLILDGEYDANELGASAGELTIYIEDNDLSYENLAKIVLDVKKAFDAAGVKFCAVDLVLEYPRADDGSRKDGRVEVMDFLYSDIYVDGMVERVKASDEAARSYYESQNEEKIKEQTK